MQTELSNAAEAAPISNENGPRADDYSNGLYSAASLAGSLLPAVESVDATLLPEYFWRAISFRLPRVGDKRQVYNAKSSDARLAMMLARYKHDIAKALFQPGQAYGTRAPGLATLALIDPARAAAKVESPAQAHDSAARVQLAQLLVLDSDALWRKLNGWLVLWSIDTEDIIEY